MLPKELADQDRKEDSFFQEFPDFWTLGCVGGAHKQVVVENGDIVEVGRVIRTVAKSSKTHLLPLVRVGGAMRVAYITNNLSTWLVLDWQNVRVYQESEADSFQIWIGMDGEEDISFTYGNAGNGYKGRRTVGAENENGTIGQSWLYNQTGMPVTNGTELKVVSVFNPGGTHQITYSATGAQVGDWTNCALLNSPQIQGVNAD